MKSIINYIAGIGATLIIGCATTPIQDENERLLTIRSCNLSKIVLDQAEDYALLACSLNGNKYICDSAESRYSFAKKIKEESCVDNLFEKK